MVTQLPWRFLFFLHHYLDFLLHLSNLSESLLEDKQGLGIAASGFIQGLNSEIVQTLISSPKQALNKVHTIFFIQLTRILCFEKARKVVKQCLHVRGKLSYFEEKQCEQLWWRTKFVQQTRKHQSSALFSWSCLRL